MEEPDGGPEISPIVLTIIAIVFLLALLLLYRHLVT